MIFEEEEIKFQRPCVEEFLRPIEGGKRIEGRGDRDRDREKGGGGDDYNKRCVHHGPPAKINERPGRETMKTEFQWLEKNPSRPASWPREDTPLFSSPLSQSFSKAWDVGFRETSARSSCESGQGIDER